MKNYKMWIYIAFIFLIGCKGGMTQTSGGLENVGFVSCVGEAHKYKGGVLVTIDTSSPVIAEVASPTNEPGRHYIAPMRIPSGKHTMKVSYQGRVIFQRQIFLSSQETIKVTLP